MILFKVQKAIEIKVFRLIKMVVRVICRIILFNKLDINIKKLYFFYLYFIYISIIFHLYKKYLKQNE